MPNPIGLLLFEASLTASAGFTTALYVTVDGRPYDESEFEKKEEFVGLLKTALLGLAMDGDNVQEMEIKEDDPWYFSLHYPLMNGYLYMCKSLPTGYYGASVCIPIEKN